MLTVKQFVQLAPFNEMEIVAGHAGLDNIISSVNIMDNPDALDWFSVGELLLTSGYFFKDSMELQDQMMRKLDVLNCPALCIKPHRYFGTIPENMIALSNELGLPLIKLPYGLSFSKIMSRLMEELSDKFDSLNKESLDIHTQFFNISLHGGGLQQISLTLAKLCKSSVLLLDRNWALLHWTNNPDRPHQLADWISLEKNEIPFSEEFIQSFPPEFEKLQKPIVRLFSIDENKQEFQCTVLSVYFQSKHYGFIVLWEPSDKLNEHSYIALENGAMAFSLERIRNDEVERARNRIRRDFLDELLLGKITSKETLSNLADLHGINLDLNYTAIVFPIVFLEHRKEKDLVLRNQLENVTMKQLLNYFDHLATETKESEIIFSRKKHIIVLVGSKTNMKVTYLKKYAEFILKKVESAIPTISATASIGKTVTHISQINESFHQAQETMRLSENSLSTKENKIAHFDDFIVQYFLVNNIKKEEMNHYFQQTLGILFQYDRKNQSELMETLESLITYRFNIAESARALFIHRNTLLYRMEKIESILEIDLKDAEEVLKLQLALKIYQLLDLKNMSR